METEHRTTTPGATPDARKAKRVACRYVELCQVRANVITTNGGEPAPVPGALDTTLAVIMAIRNGCDLDLDRLLVARMDDLDHDVGGIIQHVDKRTGKVGGLFSPRLLRRVPA
jgi:hypothetical protein